MMSRPVRQEPAASDEEAVGPDVVAVPVVADATLGLLADLRAALGALGADADAVAGTLRAAGVRGWRGCADMSPVNRWLYARLPDVNAWFGAGYVRAWRAGGAMVQLALPVAVADFLEAFDGGLLPELQLELDVPALPGVPLLEADRPWTDPAPVGGPRPRPRSLQDVDAVAGPAAVAASPQPAAWSAADALAAFADPAQAAQLMVVPGSPAAPAVEGVPHAHQAYADAVVHELLALGIGVRVHRVLERCLLRQVEVVLDDPALAAAWSDCALAVWWTEVSGWSYEVCDAATGESAGQTWWHDPEACDPVLPAAKAVAAWVRRLLDPGPRSVQDQAVESGVRPLWRPAGHDPHFDWRLVEYVDDPGHLAAEQARQQRAGQQVPPNPEEL